MEIKIIKCSGIGYWYRTRIGDIFNAVHINKLKYQITDKVTCENVSFVDVSDAQILEENIESKNESQKEPE